MIKNFHTAVFCLIIISSCTTGSITFQNLYTSIKPIVNPDKSIPDQYNEDFPYAYASVRVGRGQIIYVVLSEADNKVLRWISNDGFEIKTINGKIIASNGFEKNISFLNANHELALSNIKEMNFVVSISSDTHSAFDANMNLIRKKKDEFIEEEFSIKSIKWSGKNKFYLNNEGKVYRSINFINPLMPKVEMNFYKLHKDH